jgi:hypothetical protein
MPPILNALLSALSPDGAVVDGRVGTDADLLLVHVARMHMNVFWTIYQALSRRRPEKNHGTFFSRPLIRGGYRAPWLIRAQTRHADSTGSTDRCIGIGATDSPGPDGTDSTDSKAGLQLAVGWSRTGRAPDVTGSTDCWHSTCFFWRGVEAPSSVRPGNTARPARLISQLTCVILSG